MDLAVWRDLSLLWLIILTLIAALPFGVLFFFAIKGMQRLRQLAKQYLPQARDRVQQVRNVTEKASQKVASPFINAQARAAQVDGVTKAILRGRKRG